MKHQHFKIVGDGRSDGTEQNSSGLGDAQTLATNIVGNIASCLINAGWAALDTSYTGNTCQTKTVGNNSICLDIDTSHAVVEAPLQYTTSIGTTKIYIIYAWAAVDKYAIFTHLNDSSSTMGWKYVGSASGRSYPLGLSVLYVPPNCASGEEMKISSTIEGNYKSLAYTNTNAATYTWHILTDNDFVCLMLHASNWNNNKFKGYCYGPMIAELLNSDDTSNDYKSYMAWNFSPEQDELEASDPNDYNMVLGNARSYYDTPSSTPYIQFYNSTGSLIVCNNLNTSYNYLGTNKSLVESNYHLLGVSNIGRSDVDYGKVLVGGLPTTSGYANGQPKVSDSGYLKGIIGSNYLVSIGSVNLSTFNNDTFTIGTMFDGKKYCYLGAGICVSWDQTSTIGLLNDSDNEIIPVT